MTEDDRETIKLMGQVLAEVAEMHSVAVTYGTMYATVFAATRNHESADLAACQAVANLQRYFETRTSN